MKYCLILAFALSVNFAAAQDSKFSFELVGGLGAGWWIEKTKIPRISNEKIEWASSRLSLDAPLSTSILYKYSSKFIVGLGFTYRYFMAQNLYIASPMQNSSTIPISNNTVEIIEYYVILSSTLLSSESLLILPRFNIGSFSINSIHPLNDNFSNKVLLRGELLFEFPSKKVLSPFIGIYYSNLSFISRYNSANSFKNYDNAIESIGLKTGLRIEIPK